MAVAGPERSGSGRGVPVPSITICVFGFGFGPRRRLLAFGSCVSIGPDVGGLDHRLPSLGSGFEQGAGLGAIACDRLQRLGAKPCLQIGGLQGVLDLAFEQLRG